MVNCPVPEWLEVEARTVGSVSLTVTRATWRKPMRRYVVAMVPDAPVPTVAPSGVYLWCLESERKMKTQMRLFV
jgi:hypothetical protein